MTYSQMYRSPRAVRRSQSVGLFQANTRALGPISNILFLAAVLAIMGLLYLTQITKTSVFGIEVNDLKAQKTELEQDNQSLRIEAARLQSIERIKTSAVAGQLEGGASVTFAEDSASVQ